MTFLLAARQGRTGGARWAVGIAVVIALYLLSSIGAAAILFGAAGEPADAVTLPTLPLGAFGPAATLALLLLPSVAVLVSVALVTPLVHHRSPASVVRADSRPRWRRAGLGALVWTASAAAFETLSFLLYPESYTWTFDAARFLPLAIVAVLLVPLQSAAEETFFRGYLMQGLGIGMGSGWGALLGSSVLFAAVHLGNPELERFGRVFLVYYAAIGIVLGLMTLFDDGLELAIGAHTANNLWGALVVSFPGSVLDTPALFRMEGVPPEVMAALGGATAATSLLVLWILLGWSTRWRVLGKVKEPPPATATMD